VVGEFGEGPFEMTLDGCRSTDRCRVRVRRSLTAWPADERTAGIIPRYCMPVDAWRDGWMRRLAVACCGPLLAN